MLLTVVVKHLVPNDFIWNFIEIFCVVGYLWDEEGSEVPTFKSAPPSNLGSPSHLVLQGPLFRPCNITYHPLKQS